MTVYRGKVALELEIEFDTDAEPVLHTRDEVYTKYYCALYRAACKARMDQSVGINLIDELIDVHPISPEEAAFSSYEYYTIEEENGKKYMHIMGYVWQNDHREDGDYTVTEYTGVYIPLKQLCAMDPDERWELIQEEESACQQYEGDYEWDELWRAGYGSPELTNGVISTGAPFSATEELGFAEIVPATPCGDYYYRV